MGKDGEVLMLVSIESEGEVDDWKVFFLYLPCDWIETSSTSDGYFPF